MNNLPNRKGTYALILFLGSRRRIRVGKLGIAAGVPYDPSE